MTDEEIRHIPDPTPAGSVTIESDVFDRVDRVGYAVVWPIINGPKYRLIPEKKYLELTDHPEPGEEPEEPVRIPDDYKTLTISGSEDMMWVVFEKLFGEIEVIEDPAVDGQSYPVNVKANEYDDE